MHDNFADLRVNEYLAITVAFALRQAGYRIDPIARVRTLAWLSAQYELLTATT